MNERTKALMEPFPKEAVKKRQGAGGKTFDYVEGAEVKKRLIKYGEYDWKVNSIQWVTDSKGSYWLCTGTLTLPDLGSRDGVGTSLAANEDSPKSAATDALKVAATLFGVALELYFDTHPQTAGGAGEYNPYQRQAQASSRPKTYIEGATQKGAERVKELFFQWEDNFTVTRLAEVTGVEIVESGNERDTLWNTFNKLTTVQLNKVEEELKGKKAAA